MAKMNEIFDKYIRRKAELDVGLLSENQRGLFTQLLIHMDPLVHILTHLSEYKNPHASFRRNRLNQNDPKFELFNQDLETFVDNNRNDFGDSILTFYRDVEIIIQDIMPRAN